MQEVLDSVATSARGIDVSIVKATLAGRWRRQFGVSLDDPQLSSWAQQLVAGTRVMIRVECSAD
jgi:hypothetical protein